MTRSAIRERQVVDSDFLSEAEHLEEHSWTVISGNYTASAREQLLLDSSSTPFIVTLPSSPSEGDIVSFLDSTNSCDTNNVTISGNGEKIVGLQENFIVDLEGKGFDLVYSSATVGWGYK